MESNGEFEFTVTKELRSQTFTANRKTIKIFSKCRRYNSTTGLSESSTNYKYTLTLYKKGGGVVDSYTGSANNQKTTKKFSVEKGEEYYFVLTCNPTHEKPYSLRGTGRVRYVTV